MEYQNFDLLCRACMSILTIDENSTDHTKYDLLLTADLREKYILSTALNVDSQDGLPKYVCVTCCDKLNEFHQFHLMCVETADRLRELQQSHSVLEEKPIIDLDLVDAKIETYEEEPLNNNSDILGYKRRRGRPPKMKNCRKAAQEQPILSTDILIDNVKVVNVDREKSLEVEETIEENSLISYEDDTEDNIEEVAKLEQPKTAKTRRSKIKVVSAPSSINRNKNSTSGVYQCELCPSRFFVEHRLIAHKRSHEGLMPYPCPRVDCERSFNRWHCLSEHLKQHEGTNRLYTCDENGCGRVYKHKPTLMMHLRKYHKVGPELKSHICEVCGKVFKSSAILNDHRYTHKDKSELPLGCEVPQCPRRFSNKEKLKVHMKRHAGIKNFMCPYCGMRKTTRNELKIHINYHTLERTWTCRFCAQIFNSAGNLKMHVRTVHERAKDYACRFCERTFAKPDTRKYHEMTHTGEKPNECKECGKRFTQPAALRTHRKIHQRNRAEQKPLVEETQGIEGSVGDTDDMVRIGASEVQHLLEAEVVI